MPAHEKNLPKKVIADLDRLQGVAEHALAHLKTRGADHAEISVATGSNLEVSVRMGEVDLVKEAASSGMSVRIVHGDRSATSSTNDLAPEAVAAFLDRTLEMAELSEPDPLALPPDPAELTKRFRDLDLFDPKTARISASVTATGGRFRACCCR